MSYLALARKWRPTKFKEVVGQGITSTPCGECATCKEIDQGRFVDLLEIDAASRTKVEDTRELLDNVQYKPARGRFKVYLIDEVHMLSRHSVSKISSSSLSMFLLKKASHLSTRR